MCLNLDFTILCELIIVNYLKPNYYIFFDINKIKCQLIDYLNNKKKTWK